MIRLEPEACFIDTPFARDNVQVSVDGGVTFRHVGYLKPPPGPFLGAPGFWRMNGVEQARFRRLLASSREGLDFRIPPEPPRIPDEVHDDDD